MSEKPKKEKPQADVERPVRSPAPQAETDRSTLAKGEDTSRSDKTFTGIKINEGESDS